jgi:TolB-like protein/DNA-binding winged helix-turn-helix (wHTH) protein
VRRAGTVIRLQALSFDLLITLVRAAPALLSFEQLAECVWPGLVITPETIVQRVKLLRGALGDEAHAPRYIEGVRGRGYRLIADVRPLTEKEAVPASSVPPSFKEPKEEEGLKEHAGATVTETAAVSSASLTRSTVRRPSNRVPFGWIAGILSIAVMLAISWAIVDFRGGSQPAERPSPRPASAVIRSLAVLPLANLSGDKEEEYFADGMTDALTTDLAQIGSLRVISRTSAMHFKASRETTPQIGRDLHVDALVEGAVTRGKNRVRVTAQLVDANSDHNLWARTYERDLKDVLVLQDEIAHDIAKQIQVKLTAKAHSPKIPVHIVDPEAYDDYLMGLYWGDQFTPEGADKACDYFRKAIAKDPGYASAYAELALCQRSPAKTRELIVKALALDPSLAEAHVWLATEKLLADWDWPGAEAEYKEALALNPNYAPAHRWYSYYLVAAGRPDDALREIDRAQELDPYSTSVIEWRGQVLYHARRYDDALREMQTGLEMHPGSPALYWDMADVYEQKKMFSEAFAARQRALSPKLNNPTREALAGAYKRSGYNGYLLKLAEAARAGNPLDSAHFYALAGDEPRAIAALETAYKRHMGVMVFIRSAPELDSIRSSPHYRDFVRRIGYPQPTSTTSESAP